MVNIQEIENFSLTKVADSNDGFEEHQDENKEMNYNKTKLINITLLGIVFMTSGSR